MSKEMSFFIYLLEKYASYKETSADEVLRVLKEKNLVKFVRDMYEMYHTERLENAYADLDSLIATGKTAF